jgi:hypothetical protein
MNLMDEAKQDILEITSDADNGFGKEITFTAPDNSEATVTGLHTKHHLGVDSDGNAINTKNAHIAVSESLLTDQNYPVRNSKGEVSLRNHIVSVSDSTGTVCTYKIKETYPNESTGLIVCILSDYATNN